MNMRIGQIKPHHAHRYFTRTTIDNGHYHFVEGFTRTVNGNALDQHFHLFRGITSYENNHYHRYYGKTGPAIPMGNGDHYHLIENRTYYNYDQPLEVEFGGVLYSEDERPKHDHNFKGNTFETVGYDPFLFQN